jgi:hypothetical protein
MSDVIVESSTETIVVETELTTVIITAGEQGPTGPQGLSTNISGAPDVDITDLQDGSLLIYSAQEQKWVANTQLTNQSLESGQY